MITTINPPTPAIAVVSELCRTRGWRAVVVGDTKSPANWSAPGIDYLSVARQRELFGALADLVPYRHYGRKNLGYLHAIRSGARLILETDDDNIPYESFGASPGRTVRARPLGGAEWINVYKHFVPAGAPQIWPRGLPLDFIGEAGRLAGTVVSEQCPIQQYLADEDPDVDAIYRLTTTTPVHFRKDAEAVILDAGAWVPFNSQNTLFFAEAFPLLYLPCHVSFRMTDIWRSFVAQRVLWHLGQRLAFLPATVAQTRNEHDLMRDFADEVPGYLNNRKIGKILGDLRLAPGATAADAAQALWEELVRTGIVPPQELPIIAAWFDALGQAAT